MNDLWLLEGLVVFTFHLLSQRVFRTMLAWWQLKISLYVSSESDITINSTAEDRKGAELRLKRLCVGSLLTITANEI